MSNNVRTIKDRTVASRRGHPQRHEGESFKTIAWYHALTDRAAVSSPKELVEALNAGSLGASGCVVDEKTLYRYRSGTSSPTCQRLGHIESLLPGARETFDVGPDGVPLWSAMWELTSAPAWQFAEALMPNGNWPSSIGNLFCEDDLLGRVLEFRASVGAIGAVELQSNLDLTALAAALRVVRIHEELGRGARADLHMLLSGCLALPGAQDALGRHGIAEQMPAWLEVRFKRPLGFVDPKSRTSKKSWMHDTGEFYQASKRASLLFDSAGEALRTWLFKS